MLLLHIGAFDARMLPRLLAGYKNLGFRLVSLEPAENEPFYLNDTKLLEQAGAFNLRAAAGAKAIRPAPQPPIESLNSICR